MTHASLFSGIGGFDLAAEWAGWTNAFNCEKDPFCQRVLKYHFPHAKQYDDIKQTDFTIWRGKIDVLTGGFPCQPFSSAGKRKGTDDDRYLWPEMLRAIREIAPHWIVGENVLGIVNWNDGLVFEQVCADLENEGYEVQPYLLPACGVGAPHRRYRTWFVAYRTDTRTENVQRGQDGVLSDKFTAYPDRDRFGERTDKQKPVFRSKGTPYDRTDGKTRIITHSESNKRSERRVHTYRSEKAERYFSRCDTRAIRDAWKNFPTESPVCRRDDGFPDRLDGITFPKWRAESIKAYGNAVVPQLVYQIFRTINEFEKLNNAPKR